MSKTLVAYFSAGGATADAAKKLAKLTNGELYEIRPEVPYTKEDLNWQNQNSRSSLEMKHKDSRPALADKNADVAQSDTILLGFPIWWYTAPTIINTFLESYDFSGKRIILFATSGSSGFGKTSEDLKKSVSEKATIEEGIVVHGKKDSDEWKKWLASLNL